MIRSLLKLTRQQFVTSQQSVSLSRMAEFVGPVQTTIERKLEENFQPVFLQVFNESYKHCVPKNSETHFKVVVVSDSFTGKTPIQRHRTVNSVLQEELNNGVHALSIQAKTTQQWEKSQKVIADTPPCLGKSKITIQQKPEQ